MLYAEICSVLVLYVCVYDGDVSENIEICKNVMEDKNNCISSRKPEQSKAVPRKQAKNSSAIQHSSVDES